MFVVLTRPGNTVVAWPKGEPMVMASRVEEVARRFLGLAAGALLARPGKTVVAWPKGEPMVMPTGVEEMVRRLLGLAE